MDQTNQKTAPTGGAYQIRQGDVLIEAIVDPAGGSTDDLKQAPSPDGLAVVANGEVTGHRHVLDRGSDGGVRSAVPINAQFWTGDGTIDDSGVLLVREDAYIKHDEHAALPVPAGRYNVVKQQEYEPAAPPRRVAD